MPRSRRLSAAAFSSTSTSPGPGTGSGTAVKASFPASSATSACTAADCIVPAMRLENSFEVPAPPEQAWALLLDVPRVVPCMPGAELTETVDESHWKAQIAVKLGPMSMTFGADIARETVDEASRRVVLATKARELK